VWATKIARDYKLTDQKVKRGRSKYRKDDFEASLGRKLFNHENKKKSG
jgi:hypothetical protein